MGHDGTLIITSKQTVFPNPLFVNFIVLECSECRDQPALVVYHVKILLLKTVLFGDVARTTPAIPSNQTIFLHADSYGTVETFLCS